MKNILVPTDFSTQAGHALDFALQLAKKSDGIKKAPKYSCIFLLKNFFSKTSQKKKFCKSYEKNFP